MFKNGKKKSSKNKLPSRKSRCRMPRIHGTLCIKTLDLTPHLVLGGGCQRVTSTSRPNLKAVRTLHRTFSTRTCRVLQGPSVACARQCRCRCRNGAWTTRALPEVCLSISRPAARGMGCTLAFQVFVVVVVCVRARAHVCDGACMNVCMLPYNAPSVCFTLLTPTSISVYRFPSFSHHPLSLSHPCSRTHARARALSLLLSHIHTCSFFSCRALSFPVALFLLLSRSFVLFITCSPYLPLISPSLFRLAYYRQSAQDRSRRGSSDYLDHHVPNDGKGTRQAHAAEETHDARGG